MNKEELIRKSKFLSLVLRHDPAKIEISLDSAGWTPVDEFLKKANLSMDELEYIVKNNNKKRFEFFHGADGERDYIRASQGHSVKVELEYEEQEPPEMLYHGTCDDSYSLIVDEGIKKMSRHHVHLSCSSQTAFWVGNRHGPPIVVEVKAGDMHRQGYKFYLSTNGVWLTDYVPPSFME